MIRIENAYISDDENTVPYHHVQYIDKRYSLLRISYNMNENDEIVMIFGDEEEMQNAVTTYERFYSEKLRKMLR